MASIKERVNSSGNKSYTVTVRLKGMPAQYATFERITDAKKWAKVTEAAIYENRHFTTSEDKSRTFGDMVDKYLTDIVPVRYQKKAAKSAIECHLKWWKEQLGSYTLVNIKPKHISVARDELLKEYTKNSQGKITRKSKNKSPATVARYLASLSVVYTVAVNEWGWLQNNPVKKVAKPIEPRGRDRFLSDKEREKLLKSCLESDNQKLYPLVVLALSTGARRNELLTLKWLHVDFKRRVILLEDTKNGERRTIPLVGKAHAVLHSLKDEMLNEDEFIFWKKDRLTPMDIRKPWAKALEESKIDNFRFHDLRHSAASYLAMNGATLAEIAEVLGHKTLQMVKRYAHMTEQHTISVVERMNKKIF